MWYCAPALLTSMSSFPPVLVSTSLAAAAIEEALVTSRATMWTLGSEPRSPILDGVRAVAKTVSPRFWYATARAWPMPPVLHPVMRTDFLDMLSGRLSWIGGYEILVDLVDEWLYAQRWCKSFHFYRKLSP